KAATLCPPCMKARSVRRAAEKYQAVIASTGRAPLRTCKVCKQTKPAEKGQWPLCNGSPSGRLCLACFNIRQEQVDERMRLKRAKSPPGQLQAILLRAGELQKQASVLGPDADNALWLGARVINAYAERAGEKLGEAVEDTESEFHRSALELIATRSIPQAVVNSAAIRLARELRSSTRGKRRSKGPRFVLNIGLTHGP